MIVRQRDESGRNYELAFSLDDAQGHALLTVVQGAGQWLDEEEAAEAVATNVTRVMLLDVKGKVGRWQEAPLFLSLLPLPPTYRRRRRLARGPSSCRIRPLT